jgi:hypothetical protein
VTSPTIQTVYLTTPREPSIRLPFRHLPELAHPNTSRDPCADGDGPTLLLRHRITTTTSIVYRANWVIVKTALPQHQGHLDNEVEVYRYLMRTSASRHIPKFYGYFGYQNTKAIILSDEGPTPFNSLEDLSVESK